MTNTLEQRKQLENLLLSEDLEELSLKTKQFNIFNALKLQNAEIRHSNFLGWLMAPYETHGLGDYFLKEFLKSAIKEFSCDDKLNLNLSDIALKSFANAEIRREHKNIDILVIDNNSKFLCVVENKTWTGEHDNQLLRYAQIVDKDFAGYEKLFIFLTPPGSLEDFNTLLERQDKNCESQTYYYIPMSYEQVFKAIEKTLKFNEKHLNADVKTFIEHYKNMIERNIMGNTDKEIVDLCRRIYREHKDAIDLIKENNDFRSELFEILNEVLNEDESIEISNSENNVIIAIPNGIKNIEKLRFANWQPDNLVLHLFFINCTRGYKDLCLAILLGPVNKEDKDKRTKLIELLKDKNNFGTKFSAETKDWPCSSVVQLLTAQDYYNFNSREEVKSYLKQKINEIKPLYVDKLREIINTAIDNGIL